MTLHHPGKSEAMPRPRPANLHELRPNPSARKRGGFDWDDLQRGAQSGKVTAHFGDVASELERFIVESPEIVGCVAWITSTRLVAALAARPVALIVNKEWSLRETDTKPASVRHRDTLRKLRGGILRSSLPAPLRDAAGADELEAVRCVGYAVRGYSPVPLMHHKFIVRLDGGRPTAVWTGSFNFTVAAERSFETGLEIHDPKIAAAFLAEFARVATLSEPLEFQAGKAAPDWSARKPARMKANEKPARKPAKKTPAKQTASKSEQPVRRRTRKAA
ncbi:phospholipase D-like domain-containing protein [Agromyces sp. NPDC057679]|uniref:phospholipase D-like domain-containing protein n=1 Tax=Agromyces sp. NPDC057679 TaxID=3346207 RepID=UPI00366BBAFF